MRRAWIGLLALASLGLSLACAKVHDPTTIFGPPPEAPVVLKLGRKGDGVYAITHVWVEDSGGQNVLTLSTTTGLSEISYAPGTPSSGYCSIAGGQSSFWPSYCGANMTNQTDANTHATIGYNSDTALFFTWDWKDRSGTVVPDGTYYLKGEISGYLYPSYIADEATVTIIKDGKPGSATGTVSGVGAWLSASVTWKP